MPSRSVRHLAIIAAALVAGCSDNSKTTHQTANQVAPSNNPAESGSKLLPSQATIVWVPDPSGVLPSGEESLEGTAYFVGPRQVAKTAYDHAPEDLRRKVVFGLWCAPDTSKAARDNISAMVTYSGFPPDHIGYLKHRDGRKLDGLSGSGSTVLYRHQRADVGTSTNTAFDTRATPVLNPDFDAVYDFIEAVASTGAFKAGNVSVTSRDPLGLVEKVLSRCANPGPLASRDTPTWGSTSEEESYRGCGSRGATLRSGRELRVVILDGKPRWVDAETGSVLEPPEVDQIAEANSGAILRFCPDLAGKLTPTAVNEPSTISAEPTR